MAPSYDDVEALDDDESSEPGAAPFRIDTVERAAWLTGKNMALDAREAVLETQYAAMKAAIRRKREGLDARFGAELLAFVQAETANRRERHLDTLQGRLQLRHVDGGLRVADSARALEWARLRCRQMIGVVEREVVQLDVLKRHVAETGEVPDGVVVVEPYDSLTIKPAPAPRKKP